MSGCFNKNSFNKTNKFQEKLEGNWVAYGNDENKRTFISFNLSNNNCFATWILKSNYSYQITGNELALNNLQLTEERFRKHKFKIEKISSDELILTPITNNTKTVLKRYEQGFDKKIRFEKIPKRNDFEFQIIGFKSSGCYGSCSSFHLEINKNGGIVFHGKENVPKIGFHKGKVQHSKVDEIGRLIKIIDWKNLKENNPDVIIDDDQSFSLKLKVNNQIYSKTVYNSSNEMTVGLRVLINKLSEFQNFDNLEKVNWVNNGFQLEMKPPPPPMKKNK